MSAIRVLQVFTIMNRGGAETMIMNYYRNIDRSKIQFDFMVHRQERGVFDDEIEALGGRIYRMSPVSPLHISKYKAELRRFFDEHKEYQIVHDNMSELGYYALAEAERHGVPCRICHAHNAPDFSKETFREKLKMFGRLYLCRKVRSVTTHFFACSRSAGLWLFGKQHESELVWMRNAIDADHFAYSELMAVDKKRVLGLDNKFVVCHVGSFKQQKNHSFLIDIFNSIHVNCKDSVLLLIGDGPLRPRIEAKVERLGLQDSVKFLGSRDDVPDLLNASDVLLFPSFFEGLSVALIEAQATGIKCVLTNNVAEEAIICHDNVELHSLKEAPSAWAAAVLRQRGYQRHNVTENVKTQGWDIKASASWLQNTYLSYLTH